MQHSIVQYCTYSSWLCLKNHGNCIIWENKHKYIWMYGINPVGPPVAAFAVYFPALAVAEFDGSSSLGETACQDEWQVFVASGDDHARGKYTKGGKLGSGPQAYGPKQVCALIWARGRQQKAHMTCTSASYSVPKCQMLSQLHHFRFENKPTLSQRWGFKVHPNSWDQRGRCIRGSGSHAFVANRAVKCLLSHILCMTL